MRTQEYYETLDTSNTFDGSQTEILNVMLDLALDPVHMIRKYLHIYTVTPVPSKILRSVSIRVIILACLLTKHVCYFRSDPFTIYYVKLKQKQKKTSKTFRVPYK